MVFKLCSRSEAHGVTCLKMEAGGLEERVKVLEQDVGLELAHRSVLHPVQWDAAPHLRQNQSVLLTCAITEDRLGLHPHASGSLSKII